MKKLTKVLCSWSLLLFFPYLVHAAQQYDPLQLVKAQIAAIDAQDDLQAFAEGLNWGSAEGDIQMAQASLEGFKKIYDTPKSDGQRLFKKQFAKYYRSRKKEIILNQAYNSCTSPELKVQLKEEYNKQSKTSQSLMGCDKQSFVGSIASTRQNGWIEAAFFFKDAFALRDAQVSLFDAKNDRLQQENLELKKELAALKAERDLSKHLDRLQITDFNT